MGNQRHEPVTDDQIAGGAGPDSSPYYTGERLDTDTFTEEQRYRIDKPLTEERVREIVRDELRRAGIEPG